MVIVSQRRHDLYPTRRGSRLEALAARFTAHRCLYRSLAEFMMAVYGLDMRCLEDESRFMEMMLK